ncbi:MAG TPA: GNAT family N-acetyltransferase [Pyrinomonadaceae bacterium]
MTTAFQLTRAETAEEFAVARELFEEYAAALDVDLCFQNFERELNNLAAEYGPPEGRLLLASAAGEPVGCVGVRKLADGVCEMKRLYVRPRARGTGLGRLLANEIVGAARELGYGSMRLDTLPSMKEAVPLYRSIGFKETEAYRYNPVEGTIYMELDLSEERG